MTKLFCKSCGCDFIVSEIKIVMSDNDWFYCPDCGSGNVEYVDEVEIVQENDISWINFSCYGLSETDMLHNFDRIEQSLIRAWEASWEEQ